MWGVEMFDNVSECIGNQVLSVDCIDEGGGDWGGHFVEM